MRPLSHLLGLALAFAPIAACAESGRSSDETPDGTANDANAETASSDSLAPPDTAAPDEDAQPHLSNGLVAVPGPADGPRLELAATFESNRVVVQIVARGVGSVFGLSYHLVTSPALYPTATPDVRPVLGPPSDALHIVAVRDGDVALGGTRRAPPLGETEIAQGTILAEVVFAPAPGSYRIGLTTAYARRADGSLVPLAAQTGTLTITPEVTP